LRVSSKEVEVVVDASVSPEISALFAAHAPFARRLLRRFGVPEADVPDACQDVFLVVHRKLPDFEARAAHRSWIFGICVRVAADYRKRAHRRYERLGDPTAREVAELPHGAQPERDLVRRAQRALAELDDDKRRVFVLHELEELTMPEVAAVLGCPLKTAFSRFYSARKALQQRLQSDRGSWGALALGWGGRDELSDELRAALEDAASLDPSPLLAPSSAAAAGALFPLVHTVAALTVAISVATYQARAPHGATLIAVTAASHRAAVEPASRAVRYLLAPRAAELESAPLVPALKRSPRRARAAEPAAPLPQGVEASAWVRAPERAIVPPPPARAPSTRGADLDEVLSATSIRSSMRFGPAKEGTSVPWELVPQRGRQ
jgi:RNA polymerase sigma-70 factor (ECF subfamily)